MRQSRLALPFFSKEPGFLEKISLVQYDDADLIQVTPGPSMPGGKNVHNEHQNLATVRLSGKSQAADNLQACRQGRPIHLACFDHSGFRSPDQLDTPGSLRRAAQAVKETLLFNY